jgi:hypothetical protein
VTHHIEWESGNSNPGGAILLFQVKTYLDLDLLPSLINMPIAIIITTIGTHGILKFRIFNSDISHRIPITNKMIPNVGNLS